MNDQNYKHREDVSQAEQSRDAALRDQLHNERDLNSAKQREGAARQAAANAPSKEKANELTQRADAAKAKRMELQGRRDVLRNRYQASEHELNERTHKIDDSNERTSARSRARSSKIDIHLDTSGHTKNETTRRNMGVALDHMESKGASQTQISNFSKATDLSQNVSVETKESGSLYQYQDSHGQGSWYSESGTAPSRLGIDGEGREQHRYEIKQGESVTILQSTARSTNDIWKNSKKSDCVAGEHTQNQEARGGSTQYWVAPCDQHKLQENNTMKQQTNRRGETCSGSKPGKPCAGSASLAKQSAKTGKTSKPNQEATQSKRRNDVSARTRQRRSATKKQQI